MWALFDSSGQQRTGLAKWQAIVLVADNHDPAIFCCDAAVDGQPGGVELRWDAATEMVIAA